MRGCKDRVVSVRRRCNYEEHLAEAPAFEDRRQGRPGLNDASVHQSRFDAKAIFTPVCLAGS